MDNLQGMKDWVSAFLILIFVCGPMFWTIVQNPLLQVQILIFIIYGDVCPQQNLSTSEIWYISIFVFCHWKTWMQPVFHN